MLYADVSGIAPKSAFLEILQQLSPVYITKKAIQGEPGLKLGSTWVEATHVDFSSVNAYLPGLNPGTIYIFLKLAGLKGLQMKR